MKFWNFTNINDDAAELRIEGDIIDDSDVWLYEWFGEAHASPNKFRQQLKEHDGKELRVYVDTYGGSVFAAASIYSDLKARKGKTVGIVHAKAMSAGSVILMGCDEIKVSPTAIIMIHDPITGIHGDISDFEKTLEVLGVIKDSILNAYAAKTNLKRQELSDMMSAETWMCSQEAVEKGFADGLLEENATNFANSFSAERMRIVNTANTLDLVKKYESLKNQQKETDSELELLSLWLDVV